MIRLMSFLSDNTAILHVLPVRWRKDEILELFKQQKSDRCICATSVPVRMRDGRLHCRSLATIVSELFALFQFSSF